MTATQKARMGRPPIPDEFRVLVAYNIRLTTAQYQKVIALGGAAWIRAQIDAAQRGPGLPVIDPK